ncbi:MAG: hypothetical protein CK426_01480 [Legionella sp.]|nr:MAG: hypothetical protein CK423_04580 [Legionella sp.]PJD99746.1 MAG: hypothetical protein CK426_01480 [Legionella sp.]
MFSFFQNGGASVSENDTFNYQQFKVWLDFYLSFMQKIIEYTAYTIGGIMLLVGPFDVFCGAIMALSGGNGLAYTAVSPYLVLAAGAIAASLLTVVGLALAITACAYFMSSSTAASKQTTNAVDVEHEHSVPSY